MKLMATTNSEIIISIGIPVFNGGEFIADAIKSICISKEIEGKVEILVSDNNSTDNTAEIVGAFPLVKYYRNNENLGYDRNLHNIFLKAKGKYVWTIAADDIIIDNAAIKNVINLIDTNAEVALIHIGGNKELRNDYQTYNDEQFLTDSKFQSGGVSSNIINREVWLNSQPADFFDSGWIHFGVVINIANRLKSIITKEALVNENPRSASVTKSWDSKGSSLIVMLQLIKLFRNMPQLNYSRKMQKKATLLIVSGYPKEIIKAKAKGLRVNVKLILDFIACYKFFPSFWLIYLPILLSPRSFCRYIYKQRNIIKVNNAH